MSHKTIIRATQRQNAYTTAEIFSDCFENQIPYISVTKGQQSIKPLFLPLEYLGNCREVKVTFIKFPAMR